MHLRGGAQPSGTTESGDEEDDVDDRGSDFAASSAAEAPFEGGAGDAGQPSTLRHLAEFKVSRRVHNKRLLSTLVDAASNWDESAGAVAGVSGVDGTYAEFDGGDGAGEVSDAAGSGLSTGDDEASGSDEDTEGTGETTDEGQDDTEDDDDDDDDGDDDDGAEEDAVPLSSVVVEVMDRVEAVRFVCCVTRIRGVVLASRSLAHHVRTTCVSCVFTFR